MALDDEMRKYASRFGFNTSSLICKIQSMLVRYLIKVGHRSLLDGGKVCDSLLLKGCKKVPLYNSNCSLRQTGGRIKLLPDLVWHFRVRSEYKVMHYPPE